jgi:hypothetical protein
MTCTGNRNWAIAAVVTLVVAFVPISADSQVTYKTGDVQQNGTTDRCCFNNFRFAGTCEVRIGQNEKCYDILSVLNNFNSVGNLYCGNTTVRGGWTIVDCAPGSATFEIDARKNSVKTGDAVQAPPIRGAETTEATGTTSWTGSRQENFVTPVPAESAKAQDAGLINL